MQTRIKTKFDKYYAALLGHTGLSIAYVIYLFLSYMDMGGKIFNSNSAASLGNALMGAVVVKLTLPHTIFMALAAIFSLVGLCLKRPWTYLTAAILQIIAAAVAIVFVLSTPIVIVITAVLVILGFFAYNILKKDKLTTYCQTQTAPKAKAAKPPKKHREFSDEQKSQIITELLSAIGWIIVLVVIFFVGKWFKNNILPDLSISLSINQKSWSNNETDDSLTQAYTAKTPQTKSNGTYDIGIPHLNGAVYSENAMNLDVLWVQYQLKATNQYYQGSAWDETGNLGDQTIKEIRRFMCANGYPSHSGRVDQTVIDTLADYLGNRIVPIYAGGFYERMNSIMSGGSRGSMEDIDEYSSSRKIEWVQRCLSKLGYYNSTIDGQFGAKTIRALNNFQSDHGFEERDYVSLGVARALLEACYNRGYSLNDLP